MAVRVRFAPSPTGHLHLGGLRTALFNYLFAASEGGKCILRLEDTDQERTVPGSFEEMASLLSWAGIVFDEGPREGGQYGPYVQSKRKSLHQHYAKELVKVGAAYHCFCPKERLESLKIGCNGHCRQLSDREVDRNLQMGITNAIRLKVSDSVMIDLKDKVYGHLQFTNKQINDQVLLKSDGSPTYHLANVVDDHTMEISHVLRGNEWLPSTGKHLLLYQALSWQPPVYAHLPLLLNSSGEGKLSKRNENAFLKIYRKRGFLPEALVNFTALLGWSANTDQEIFTLEELCSSFSLDGINKSGVCVDEQKLVWINDKHFSRLCGDEQRMEEFVKQLRDCLIERKEKFNLSAEDTRLSSDYLRRVILAMEERTTLVPSIPDEVPYFWTTPDFANTTKPKTLTSGSDVLPGLYQVLRSASFMSSESLKADLKQFSSDQGHPHGRVISACRYAMTGGLPGPPILEVMILLGQKEVLERFNTVINSSINTV